MRDKTFPTTFTKDNQIHNDSTNKIWWGEWKGWRMVLLAHWFKEDRANAPKKFHCSLYTLCGFTNWCTDPWSQFCSLRIPLKSIENYPFSFLYYTCTEKVRKNNCFTKCKILHICSVKVKNARRILMLATCLKRYEQEPINALEPSFKYFPLKKYKNRA